MINSYNYVVLRPMGEGTTSGGQFEAGIYLYTLFADGQIIGTKQLILTD